MAAFLYDSSYDPPAPVIPIRIGIPDKGEPRAQQLAFLDSGADATAIPVNLLRKIGARIVGQGKLSGVTGSRIEVDIFRVVIYMPTGISYGIRAIGSRDGDEIILGRDVLNQWRITLDGPGETVEIEA